MKKLSVKQKIADALMENTNGFLSVQQIASLVYKDAYMREFKKHADGLIKRNISHAIALLSEEGFVVIKDLKECENSVKMTHKIVKGYKIADKEDKETIMVNLISKKERLEIVEQTRLDFKSSLDTNNLIDKQ